ncbi:MAG: putative LPS assembly protein LptD [Bacteroidales bacterium]|nr:putative LPS assembly protein LptD [Bacteroidales bacterium]
MFQKLYFSSFLFLFCVAVGFAQDVPDSKVNKRNRRSNILQDTNNVIILDTIDILNVENPPDSIEISVLDSATLQISPNAIENIIDYQALDSIRFDLVNKKIFMFNKSEITYDDLFLEADYVEIDMDKGEIFASGMADSSGTVIGKPMFKQGEQKFKTEKMRYNINTKKGLIYTVITQEGSGFMHGEKIKKYEDNTTYVKGGKYTTCDAQCPHFELAFNKAKVIPNDKIITGPAYLRIEGVPTPLALPFGYFPNKKGRANGLIIPSYGESANRGFFFENGGFYWGINDYVDLALLGDIYTRGSWAAKVRSAYNKRYKFNGNLDVAYAINLTGEKNTADYQKANDFMFRWKHTQDPKAHPTRRFSADVNILSNTFSKFNSTNTSDYLSNTFQSGVSYSTSFAGKYNLSANIRHSQNTLTRQVDMSLPEVNFSANRFYPFRKKNRSGSLKWYENISMSYNANMKNKITTVDTLLFTENILDKMQNGIRHSIPVSSSIKILKFFNWNNTVNYTERWYSQSIDRYWNNNGFTEGELVTDTIKGFNAARDFNYNSSITTRLYGMKQFKKGKLAAFRHVLTPTMNFAYNPNFGSSKWGYYKYYQDQSGSLRQYSIYEGGLYGSPPSRKSGLASFSLTNNLEAKIRNKKDTADSRKVILIENLTFSTAYNFALDSLRWIPLVINGRTTLFKNLYVTYNSIWDPYVLDSLGKRTSKLEMNTNNRLFRMTSNDWNFSLNLAINQAFIDKLFSPKEVEVPASSTTVSTESNEWNMTLSYNLYYTNRENPLLKMFEDDVIQSLNLQGEFYLTRKWRVNFTSGYDFKSKDFSYTAIDIYRDLHCWEMRFNWIPFGFRKSWNFSINVKASVLQDLKYSLKKDFRDSY